MNRVAGAAAVSVAVERYSLSVGLLGVGGAVTPDGAVKLIGVWLPITSVWVPGSLAFWGWAALCPKVTLALVPLRRPPRSEWTILPRKTRAGR